MDLIGSGSGWSVWGTRSPEGRVAWLRTLQAVYPMEGEAARLERERAEEMGLRVPERRMVLVDGVVRFHPEEVLFVQEVYGEEDRVEVYAMGWPGSVFVQVGMGEFWVASQVASEWLS